MDTATIRADIATALQAALTALPNVTVYAYWIDNASVPAVVIDDHEAHVDNRVRINTWIVRVILPDGAKEDAYRLGDDIITLLTPLTVDPHSLAVASIIPTSALVAQQNLPGYTLNLTDDRKALCAERPKPPQPIPATGAVMGKPGYFTPVGSVPPADAVALEDLAPSPATAWDPGTWVIVAAGTEHHWDGTAWATGRAPTPPPPQLVLTVTDQTDLTVAVAITNEDPTGDPATVDWGDGDITPDLDHTYADPGTYTLIAEQVGRTDSNPVDVTVTEPPPPLPPVATWTPAYYGLDPARGNAAYLQEDFGAGWHIIVMYGPGKTPIPVVPGGNTDDFLTPDVVGLTWSEMAAEGFARYDVAAPYQHTGPPTDWGYRGATTPWMSDGSKGYTGPNQLDLSVLTGTGTVIHHYTPIPIIKH